MENDEGNAKLSLFGLAVAETTEFALIKKNKGIL